MAKGFDTIHVKAATKAHNKFDLSRAHLTTMNFGEIIPLFAEEVIPGDKFKVDGNYFSRMAPLVRPTYGKFSFNTVASFVPYYQVSNGIDGFMAGSQKWEGEDATTRTFSVKALCELAVSSSQGASGSGDTDFSYTQANGTVANRRFTKKGKYIFKVLNSLGYQLPESVDYSATGATGWATVEGVRQLSALPLLAFFKAYNDFMSQSQRFNNSLLTKYLKYIKLDKSLTSIYDASNHQLYWTGIQALFDNLYLQYENGYFTSAWQYPNSPVSKLDNNYSPNPMYVPSWQGSGDDIEFDIDDNTLGMGYSTSINQRSLDFLKSFDDWVRRNNYSGSRAVQKVYSRFGVKTEDYRANYAHIIATDKIPVQVGDITSQASTTQATLGDFAGKGIVSGSKGFSFDANEYGMLFVFAYYTVVPMYPYGCDRHVLKTKPTDYYTPEFDGLGAQAIPYCEIFENPTMKDSYVSSDIFGYTERYNEYRYGRDKITGEFRKLLPTSANTATSWNVWHNGRDLTGVRSNGYMVAQSTSMNSLAQTDSEYNRIFNMTSGDDDKFYLTSYFNVSAVRPMLSLNQVPRLGEGDTTLPKNGNVVN